MTLDLFEAHDYAYHSVNRNRCCSAASVAEAGLEQEISRSQRADAGSTENLKNTKAWQAKAVREIHAAGLSGGFCPRNVLENYAN